MRSKKILELILCFSLIYSIILIGKTEATWQFSVNQFVNGQNQNINPAGYAGWKYSTEECYYQGPYQKLRQGYTRFPWYAPACGSVQNPAICVGGSTDMQYLTVNYCNLYKQ